MSDHRGQNRGQRWWRVMLLPVLLALAAGAGVGAGAVSMPSGMVAAAAAAVAPKDECAGPVAGKHIYDCAHLLMPGEIVDLETLAAAVDRAGAPTVVYLQARDATAQQALQDAIDLMGRWNVESRPGAHDGFVMLFDLQPGNLRHGKVALFAGEKHYQHGNLPQAELDRIRTDVMTPLLADEETAAGIAAGLQMVAHDLRYGPPPPPAAQVAAANFGRIPFNVLGAIFAGVVAWLAMRLGRKAPVSGASDGVGLGSLAEPGDLSPALAGALIAGRVRDRQVEATILDFARRGLLVIEPAREHKVRVRLLRDDHELDKGDEFEREVWQALNGQADGQRVLSSADLGRLRQSWPWAKTLLRRELMERGWFNPEAAAARRRPLYLAGTVGIIGAVVALIVVAISHEAWAVIGLGLFAAAGVFAFVRGYAVPDTTVEGELAAAPWRGYLATVKDQSYEPKLDTDLPYIVGLGLLGALTPRLKAASERGYSPAWFRAPEGQHGGQPEPVLGFYPYWIAFHSGVTPTSSGSGYSGGSAGGGFSGGGAAGGGGGSAGSF